MNSRDRRESADPMDLLIRQSLQHRAGGKVPRALARRTLLARAARHQRRYALRLPSVFSRLLQQDYLPFAHTNSQNQILYVEALFGPRLGNYSFTQLR
jgi:hypothetical protein